MSAHVKRTLVQLVTTLSRCIDSCDEEIKLLSEKITESNSQRDSYVENKILAEAIIDVLDNGGDPRIAAGGVVENSRVIAPGVTRTPMSRHK